MNTFKVPTFAEHLNESNAKTRKLRPIKAIIQDFKKSKFYTPSGADDIIWDLIADITDSNEDSEYFDIFLTRGELPQSEKKLEKLANRAEEVWEKMKKLDPNIIALQKEFSDGIKRDDARADAKN